MRTPLQFVFYFAVKPEKLWEGLFSPESNRIIFMGADFEADLKPGDPAVGSSQIASVHFSTRAKSFEISSDCRT